MNVMSAELRIFRMYSQQKDKNPPQHQVGWVS